MFVATGAGAGAPGATTPFFLGEDDAPNSKTIVANSVRLSLVPLPTSAPAGGKSTQLTVIGNDTGATSSITVTNAVKITGSTADLGLF
jgi:hypothetical protein